MLRHCCRLTSVISRPTPGSWITVRDQCGARARSRRSSTTQCGSIGGKESTQRVAWPTVCRDAGDDRLPIIRSRDGSVPAVVHSAPRYRAGSPDSDRHLWLAPTAAASGRWSLRTAGWKLRVQRRKCDARDTSAQRAARCEPAHRGPTYSAPPPAYQTPPAAPLSAPPPANAPQYAPPGGGWAPTSSVGAPPTTSMHSSEAVERELRPLAEDVRAGRLSEAAGDGPIDSGAAPGVQRLDGPQDLKDSPLTQSLPNSRAAQAIEPSVIQRTPNRGLRRPRNSYVPAGGAADNASRAGTVTSRTHAGNNHGHGPRGSWCDLRLRR